MMFRPPGLAVQMLGKKRISMEADEPGKLLHVRTTLEQQYFNVEYV